MAKRRILEVGIALVIVASVLLLLEWGAGFIEPESPRERVSLEKTLGPKRPGTFRIVTLGSSTVFGMPAPPLGFVAQLEFWLERSGVSVEIVNLGAVGIPAAWVLENARRATRLEPDLVFVHTGFGPYFLDSFPIRPGEVLRSKTRGSALARMVSERRGVLERIREQAPVPTFRRGSREFDERLEIWIENVEAIADVLQESGIPFMLATNTSNISDWEPFNRRVAKDLYEPGFAEIFDRIEALLDSNEFEAARTVAEEGLAEVPDDALLTFLLARAKEGEGRFEEARQDYRRACDLDPLPWRPFSEANEAVRRIAADSDAILVDFEAALAEAAPNGLVGFELIIDNAHPTVLGGSILVGKILEAMERHGLALSREAAYFSTADPAEAFLQDVRARTGDKRLEVYAFVFTGNYFLVHPFYRNREARYFYDAAIETDPSDWRGWAGLAALSLLEGDVEVGVGELERAIALRGTSKGITAERLAPALAEALQRAGVAIDPASGRVEVH